MNEVHLNSMLQLYRETLQMVEVTQRQAELQAVAEAQLSRCRLLDSGLIQETFDKAVRTIAIVEDPWVASMRAERVKLDQILLSYPSAEALRGRRCSYTYADACYDYDYARRYILDVRDLVDGRTEEQRQRYRITPHQEKQLPQFATYFVKLKQLLLDLVQALTHAKRRIHIGNKIDLTSLLQVLRSSKTHSRNGNSAHRRTGNIRSPRNFHAYGYRSSGPWGFRRKQIWEEGSKSVISRGLAGPAIAAANADL